MSEGVDFSDSRPDPAGLVAAGKGFVVRYIPYGGYQKGLTKAEAQSYLSAGLAIALVFESTADRMLDGYGAGVYDANLCVSALASLGAPADLPIYFGADFDTTQADWAAIGAYLQGVISVLGLMRVGVYGEYDILEFARSQGLAAWFWQTYAWSQGRIFAYNHIFQYHNGVLIAGAEVDLDAAAPTFGQWGGTMADDDTSDAILFLAFMKQALGIEPSTFSDDASVQAIRAQLAALAGTVTTPHVHSFGPTTTGPAR